MFSRANSSELFDIKIIAVSPAARGLGLATDLVMRSLQLAKCLGYRWDDLGAAMTLRLRNLTVFLPQRGKD